VLWLLKFVIIMSRYYPHHYAPYLSDVKGFSDLKIEFDLGRPFLPFQQLMAVLPTASKGLLPEALQVHCLVHFNPLTSTVAITVQL